MILLRSFIALAWVLVIFNADAQVSSGEGFSPMEGVAIPKAQISQPQAVKPGVVFKDCDDCPEMVVIPAGSFLMGSPPDPEQDPFSNAKPVKVGEDNEKPQHRVNIQSFAIGKYEVTQEQWYAVMGNNPSKNKGRTLPVENVSWDDAQLFVQKLSQKTGKKYRLPSEAEWEYAARGGSTTTYPWGNSDSELHVYAWFNAIANATNPVGLKKPNQFGLYDMIGNVWEWTQDCLNGNYKGAPTDGSAWTGGDCSQRVLRGGFWNFNPQNLRTANRNWITSASRNYYDGFRVAMTIETSVDKRLNELEETGTNINSSSGKPSAFSAAYLGRLRARVRPNITFAESQLQTVKGNPEAEVEVTCSHTGEITSKKLIHSSGIPAWDRAVMNAIEKTGTLPRDENGNVPPKITFGFRPRD